MQRVIGLVQDLWFLLHHQCWGLTGAPLAYPVVVLCHGYLAALGLQDLSLPVLQKIADRVDVGVGQLIILTLAWVVAGLVSQQRAQILIPKYETEG